MKYVKRILVFNLLVLVFPPLGLVAGKHVRAYEMPNVISYIGGTIGGGYASLMHSVPNTRVLGGDFGSVGLKYQLNTLQRQFTFSVALEPMLLHSTTRINAFDLQGKYSYSDPIIHDVEMDYKLGFSRCRERNSLISLNVPVLFGKDFKQSYFSIGANVRYTFLGTYRTRIVLTTSAVDPELIDPMENLPTHNMSKYPLETQGYVSFDIDVMGMAEVGIILDKWLPKNKRGYLSSSRGEKYSYRLGLFAAYGILSINSNTPEKEFVNFDKAMSDGNTIVVSEKEITQISHASIFTTKEAIGKEIHSLMLGVKFTILLQLNKPCRCNY